MAAAADKFPEPKLKRCVSFIDGQNLFNAAKEAFGYTFPNYDIAALSRAICEEQKNTRGEIWILKQMRFYTGIPDQSRDPKRNKFWMRKLASMGRQGIKVTSRPLRYIHKTGSLGGAPLSYDKPEEKGIDVRIAVDLIRLALKGEYDVALIFSQDQDLAEAAREVIDIQREQKRWIKVASAYPFSDSYDNKRGINKTDWIKIDKALYDKCIDPKDYR